MAYGFGADGGVGADVVRVSGWKCVDVWDATCGMCGFDVNACAACDLCSVCVQDSIRPPTLSSPDLFSASGNESASYSSYDAGDDGVVVVVKVAVWRQK